MTPAQALELQALRFRDSVINTLHERGYEPLGIDPDDREGYRFLRRTTLPDFTITLLPPSSLTEIDDAILHSGRHQMRDELADMAFHKLTVILSRPPRVSQRIVSPAKAIQWHPITTWPPPEIKRNQELWTKDHLGNIEPATRDSTKTSTWLYWTLAPQEITPPLSTEH